MKKQSQTSCVPRPTITQDVRATRKKMNYIGPAGTCSTTCSVFIHLTPEQPPSFIHKRKTEPFYLPSLSVCCGYPHDATPCDRLSKYTFPRNVVSGPDEGINRQPVHTRHSALVFFETGRDLNGVIGTVKKLNMQ